MCTHNILFKYKWMMIIVRIAENQQRLPHTSSGSISIMIGRMLIQRARVGRIVSTVSIFSPSPSLSSTIFVIHLLSIVQYWSLMCLASTLAGSLNITIITNSMNTVGSFNKGCEHEVMRLNSRIFSDSGIGAALRTSLTCTPWYPGARDWIWARSA